MSIDRSNGLPLGASKRGGDVGRESVWHVRRGVKAAYYGIFTAAFFSGLGLAIQRNLYGDAPVADRVQPAVEFLAMFVIAAAAGTVLIVEAGGQAMVLAEATRDWLDRRREREIAIARAEERSALLGLLKDANPGLVIPDLPPLSGKGVREPAP